MSYVPVFPGNSYSSWLLLKRQGAAQQNAFAAQASQQQRAEYFRNHIGEVKSAEDLVGNRRLLEVALGAFGLSEDINNRFFIRKVLSEGTLSENAFALRLADTRYRELAGTFDFGTAKAGKFGEAKFVEKILSAWNTRSFEQAVGESSEALRLALNAERELAKVAAGSTSDRTKWLSIMGQRPLRQIFETVFRLPTAVGALDLDRQLEIFTQKSEAHFGSGSPAHFSDPDALQSLLRRFLLQSEVASSAFGPTTRGSVALGLLQGLR